MRSLLLAPFLLLAVACSDDGGTAQLGTTLPPTECATSTFDGSRTVVITVDDVVGGFGGLGVRSPSGLEQGIVRLSVEADPENREPITVTVSVGPQEVTAIRGVAPGATCAVDVELAAGNYVVREGERDVEFAIVELAGTVTS